MTSVLYGGTAKTIEDGSSVSIQGANDRPYDPWCADVSGLITVEGRISQLRVAFAPAPADPWNIVVYKNAVASDLECTIEASGTSCSNTADSIEVESGDRLCIEMNTDVPAVVSTATWSMVFDSYESKSSPMIGSSSGFVLSNSANRHLPIAGAASPSGTAELQVIATSGTIKNLFVKAFDNPGTPGTPTAPGAGTGYLMNALNFTTGLGLSCWIYDENTECENSTGTLTVSPGDRIALRTQPANTPAQVFISYGMTFEADVDGEFNVLGGNSANINSTADRYGFVASGAGVNWYANEATVKTPSPAVTFKSIRAWTATDPTANVSYTLRVNGVDSALTATMGNGSTTASADIDVAVSAGDLVSVESDPTAVAAGATDISFRAVVE